MTASSASLRQPDGVWVDPPFAAPTPVERAQSSERFVSLRSPLPQRAIWDRIDDFFRAVLREDADRLSQLVTSDATSIGRSRGAASGLLDHWRARMRAFSYDTLAAQQLYRSSDVEIYAYDDLDPAVLGRPTRPPEMQPGDQLARVPMVTVRTATERVFADELVFVLRRVENGYRIRAIAEDFQPP